MDGLFGEFIKHSTKQFYLKLREFTESCHNNFSANYLLGLVGTSQKNSKEEILECLAWVENNRTFTNGLNWYRRITIFSVSQAVLETETLDNPRITSELINESV